VTTSSELVQWLRRERDYNIRRPYDRDPTDPKRLSEAADRIEELEAIEARLAKTKDGKPIVHGDTIYWVVSEDEDYWGEPRGTPLSFVVQYVSVGTTFPEYEGTHTVCCDDIECGNMECYASLEEATKAGKEMLSVYEAYEEGYEEYEKGIKDPAGS
jgi:hypothetical protein